MAGDPRPLNLQNNLFVAALLICDSGTRGINAADVFR